MSQTGPSGLDGAGCILPDAIASVYRSLSADAAVATAAEAASAAAFAVVAETPGSRSLVCNSNFYPPLFQLCYPVCAKAPYKN